MSSRSGESSYSVPDRGAEYCNERVCLSVCACVRACVRVRVRVCVFVCSRSYLWNYTTDLHERFMHVTYGRGSVLLWRRSDTLSTFGFIDDVIFPHKPRLLLDVTAQLKRSAHAALGLAISCARYYRLQRCGLALPLLQQLAVLTRSFRAQGVLVDQLHAPNAGLSDC